MSSKPLAAPFAAVLWILAAMLSACATARTPQGGMVAAADPRAVEAGTLMLERGGSATDAAIAAMAVLGLVEPQSAGLGGGGFLLHLDARTSRVLAYDGRETAPAGATPDMFLDAAGEPLDFRAAVASGRSVGAPGLVPMLALAHREQGRLRWAELFEPAITLAEQGFAVSPRLHQLIGYLGERQPDLPAETRAYLFTPAGEPKPVGAVIQNPAYAATLRSIARRGPRALTEGPIADEIVRAAQAEPLGGSLTRADLRDYRPKRLTPVCAPHRRYRVCTPPPPSSGVTALEVLGLYARARPKPAGPNDVDDWSSFLWASRLAYADRDHYVADDAFSPTPTYGLIAEPYLDARAALIDPAAAPKGAVEPGDPMAALGGPPLRQRFGGDIRAVSTGTTHLTVVDANGEVAALTASVESIFGSLRMAGGFFLNNQLTDFSFAPTRDGKPVANAVAPGKRPRSSMTPTIVLDENGRFRLAVGSPGGSSIIAYVSKTLIGTLDWGLTLQEAVELPNVVARGPVAAAELKRLDPALVKHLEARGWALRPVTVEASGLHGVEATAFGLVGAADSRREGVARAPGGAVAPVGAVTPPRAP